MQKSRLYTLKKYVFAQTAGEAILLDDKTHVHEVFLCNNPAEDEKAEGPVASAVGFKTVEAFADDPDENAN